MPRNSGWWMLLLPAFLLMTAFYIVPILQVLAISVTEPEPASAITKSCSPTSACSG